MGLTKSAAKTLARESFPAHLRQRAHTIMLDRWARGAQQSIDDNNGPNELKVSGKVYMPRDHTAEYDDLASKSPTPLAGLIITSLAQTAYFDGVRMPGAVGNMEAWSIWQENGWDAKQIPLHRAAIGHGLAYASALPGTSRFGGGKTALLKGYSAKRMSAFFDEDDDEFPLHAILADPIRTETEFGIVEEGWTVRLFDTENIYYLSVKGDGDTDDDWTYISDEAHDIGFTPIVRYTNRIDLDGRATGEIEPVIPMLRRIDQDTFDRLIVQRFGAWKIRFIAGMAKPDSADQAYAEALRLKLEDLLISPNEKTKFGTMDGTDPAGFIACTDHDLRMLAAITQTPPHHLLGLSSNLQAEALAAAESGLQRKSGDFKTNAGESHEKLLRVGAYIKGNMEEARAFNLQGRWRDMESRALAQTAQALGLFATQLGIPTEMLWERVPNWTDNDTERAKKLVTSGGVDALIQDFIKNNQPPPPADPNAPDPNAPPDGNGG